MALKIPSKIDSIQIVESIEHDVSRINSIKKRYGGARDESKGPTFALT